MIESFTRNIIALLQQLLILCGKVGLLGPKREHLIQMMMDSSLSSRFRRPKFTCGAFDNFGSSSVSRLNLQYKLSNIFVQFYPRKLICACLMVTSKDEFLFQNRRWRASASHWGWKLAKKCIKVLKIQGYYTGRDPPLILYFFTDKTLWQKQRDKEAHPLSEVLWPYF